MKDLEFIRSVVKEWPEGETHVRLDRDGEICFTNDADDYADNDFYPEDIEAAKDAFEPRDGMFGVGEPYTREQWAGETL